MLNQISYYLIFGKPFIMYLGVLTLACLLFTAYISVMNLKGKTRIPFKWHPRMAIITITLALIHGILGVLLYF